MLLFSSGLSSFPPLLNWQGAIISVCARAQQLKLWNATSSLYWLRFTWARNFPCCVLDGQHSVGQCLTACVCVYVFVCVCVCVCVFTQQPFAKTSDGPVHLCVNVDSRWSCDCHSSPGRCSARHWSLHISCSVLQKPSSTDAAAELISSKSMTKSLWKHFYLCVCLCG